MSYDLILRQALKLHDEGRLDEAERLYRQILETAPDHPVVLNLLGLVAQSKGLHEQAVSFLPGPLSKIRSRRNITLTSPGRKNGAAKRPRRSRLISALCNCSRASRKPAMRSATFTPASGRPNGPVNNIIRPHCSTPLTSNRAPTWQKRKTTFRRCKNWRRSTLTTH